MNATDYDKSKFKADKYGHLTAKTKDKTHYKGFSIDIGIGNVKVWNDDDGGFVGDFPDVKSAKEHIDTK